MNPVYIKSPKHKKILVPIKALNTTQSASCLFNYEQLLQANSPYGASKFRLNKLQLQSWMVSKGRAEEEPPEESEHEMVEEEEEVKPKESPQPKGGLYSIIDFYQKYKAIHKSSSQTAALKSSPIYKYLKKIDQLRHIPQPMGMAKWQGSPVELNLG